jgi:hypothetical protein
MQNKGILKHQNDKKECSSMEKEDHKEKGDQMLNKYDTQFKEMKKMMMTMQKSLEENKEESKNIILTI